MTNNSIQPIGSNLPISFPYVYGTNAAHVYPHVAISIETITPEIAEKMLVTNVGNRDPKRESIAKAIENGEWVLNGATIVFDENGNLTDGQNRLMACIKSGKPIDTIVVRGIKRSAQITMDTGVKRVLADYLKLAGYPNYSAVGAIGLAVYRAEEYGLQGAFTMPKSGRDTVKALYEYICAMYDTRIEPLVKPSKLVQRMYPGVTVGTIGVLLDAFGKAGEDNVSEFVSQVTNKTAACTSVRLLQNRLSKNADSKNGRLPQKVVAALIIKAWNAYMLGDDIAQLKFTQGGANPERFPEVFLDYE